MAEIHQRVVLDDGSGLNPPTAPLGSLTNALSIVDGYGAPAAVTWTSATALNSTNTLAVGGYDGVMISVVTAAGISGGTLAFEVYDGAAWIPAQAGKMNSYGGQTTLTLGASLNQGFQINTAGCQQFRTRLSGAITGAGNVVITHAVSSANMPDPFTVGQDPASIANPVGAGSWNIGQQNAIGTTATLILAARAGSAGAGSGASGVGAIKRTIYNSGSTTVFLGNAGVTTATGTRVLPGGSRDVFFSGAIYGVVASGTGAVDFDEVY